jgi:hypothetical protein
METIKQLLLVLGVITSPVEHPPELCVDNCAVSDAGLALVKHFEGYSPTVYEDAAGYPTIGFGHLIKPGEKGIVKLTPKIARLYSKERTIEGFGLSRAPVFSPFPALQLSSRERCLRRFFINLTMPFSPQGKGV